MSRRRRKLPPGDATRRGKHVKESNAWHAASANDLSQLFAISETETNAHYIAVCVRD